MPKLFVNMTSEQANLCALVLSASGIAYFTTEGGGGWDIWVKDADVETALGAIKRYFRENPEAAPSEASHRQPPVRTLSGIWVGLLLTAVYAAVAVHQGAPRFMETFSASSEKILNGEAYRTVTALMLHADWAHLAGNVVAIAVFGTAVCMVVGTAPGWLLILLSGVIGNAANALLHRAGHVSIGASTAVFGAVGVLSACQFWRRRQGEDRQGLRAWLPLAGGLALLALLGAGGQRVDLMAHLFGLLAGVVLGLAYSMRFSAPLPKGGRTFCWSATAVILATGWLRMW